MPKPPIPITISPESPTFPRRAAPVATMVILAINILLFLMMDWAILTRSILAL